MKKILQLILLVIFVSFATTTINSSSQAQELISTLAANEAQAFWDEANYDEAINIWETMAWQGNNIAAWRLAFIFMSDTGYSTPQMDRAILWLTVLSDREVADAKEVLGDIYYFGRGVPQDYDTAFMWYKNYSLFEQDPDIMTRYAILIATGQGTEQDRVEAFKILYNQGKKDYIPAYLVSIQVFMDMTPVEKFLTRITIFEINQ